MFKVKYKVPDMHCSACSMRLEGIEDDLPGIRAIKASYHKQEMLVEFDETLVSEAQIQAAAQEMGYVLIPAEAESQ
jgi:copper chaperone CopZ